MTPRRKRSGYHPPRNPREVLVAIASAVAVIAVTGGLIWFFAPDEGNGSSNEPITPPIVTQSAPTSATTSPTSAPAPTESVPTESPTP